ncbi:acetyl-CoA hydrolase/transferase C-terminal domain-containing protein [Ignavibacteriales bacterium]
MTDEIKLGTNLSSSVLTNYKKKLVTAEQAVRVVKSNDNIFVHANTAFPMTLIEAMVARKEELQNVQLIHCLSVGKLPYLRPGMEGHFNHRSYFMGGEARVAVAEGRADFAPIYLHEFPLLVKQGHLHINVAMVHLSPPDEHGFCSYGVEVGLIKTAAELADVVIAQINPKMPRALGDSFIHINKIDYIVEVDEEILELAQGSREVTPEMAETYRRIGENIASLIEDGSTLQLGIGVIPDNVLRYLGDKRDLGVHSETFSDGIIDLVERGIVTNSRKGIHDGKIIAGFVLGTRALYDFIDNNPLIEFHRQEYVNDPFIIAQNKKMVAINAAMEVDITGQVCSDSIGPKLYSGFGGQVDFIRGAARSEGGKPIIALASTAKNDTISKITTILKPGAGVTTNKADVHYVVTEYGIAQLWGRTIRERVKSLINIAHPKFRDELEAYAKSVKYI